MNKRLLIITHHKLNENNGGCNASKGFVHCLASLFDECAIISPEIHPTEPYIPKDFKYYPLHDTRSKARKFFDMYRGRISGLYYAVKEHLKNHRYDVVVIDHSFSGAGISSYIKSTGAKLITIHHNVERDYLRDNSKERPVFYRYPFLYFSKKAEIDSLRNSDINLTVTERDAQVFRSWFSNICVHNWGIFEYLPIQDKIFTPKPRRNTFVITGSLCFEQSLLPIKDFIKCYWQLVQQNVPDARLLIAGRNPSEELFRLSASKEGIEIIPNPMNMAEVVQQADFYICPVFAGSGLKLRVFDGLKQGLPVLCHEVSAAGYEIIAERNCLFPYNDEETFIASLKAMLSAGVSQEDVYQAYKETFSLEAGKKRIKEILEKEKI